MIMRFALMMLCLLTMLPSAFAEETAKTFAVAPFAIHGPKDYQYLQKGIPAMLQTRLTWTDHFTPVSKDIVEQHAADPIADTTAAQKALTGIASDYLVYGSVTIMGQECSLDVQLMDKAGKVSPFASQTTLDQLIPSLETTAKQINGDVFKRPEAKPAAKTTAAGQMNPNLVFNQSHADNQASLNPQFRYETTSQDEGRWRSQSLKHKSRGMLVLDADNDGKNEIFIMEENAVYAYVAKDSRLLLLDTYEGAMSSKYLNINALDSNRDGNSEIFISAVDGESEDVRSLVLTFEKGKFHLQEDRIKFFVNVVRLPPDFIPTLVGQIKGHGRLLDPGVYELIRMSGEYKKGKRLSLPKKSNVFNFAYLPQKDGTKIIVAYNDHLIINSDKGDLQAVTEEIYAATSIRMEDMDVIPGMGLDRNDADMKYYYVPARLLITNLDKDKSYELLVNKPISIATEFFSNFRSFSQGEVHSLYWDGIGLNLVWKTRRIKGTVVDYAIADYNNDGNLDLVVCIQTYPGATGLSSKRTIITAYPLDQKLEP